MSKVRVKTADGRTTKLGRENLKASGSDAVPFAVKDSQSPVRSSETVQKTPRLARRTGQRPDPADLVRQEHERHGILMDILAK